MKTEATTDSDERWLRTLAEGTYLLEEGSRPFDVVLQEERQKHTERMRQVDEYVNEQIDLKKRIADSENQLQQTLARIESEKQQRRWKQEMLLRELKVGDTFPWNSEIGSADRTINREDGGTVQIFELKETVGVNTTVTIDSHGKVVNITRYP